MKVKLLPLELMCSKCHWIMNNPVKSGCCDTRYCLDCFRSPGKSCQCANNNHGQDYFPLESLKNAVQMAKSEMQRNAVCFVCDSIGDHQTKFCPKIECVHCGENRHIELVCPRKRPSPVMQNDDAKKIKLESDPRIEPKLQDDLNENQVETDESDEGEESFDETVEKPQINYYCNSNKVIMVLDITFAGFGHDYYQMVEIGAKCFGLKNGEKDSFFRPIFLQMPHNKPKNKSLVKGLRQKTPENIPQYYSEKNAIKDFIAYCERLERMNYRLFFFVSNANRIWYPLLQKFGQYGITRETLVHLATFRDAVVADLAGILGQDARPRIKALAALKARKSFEKIYSKVTGMKVKVSVMGTLDYIDCLGVLLQKLYSRENIETVSRFRVLFRITKKTPDIVWNFANSVQSSGKHLSLLQS